MNIQKIDIQKLKPAEYNPRKDLTPEDEEWKKIQRSIKEFGYVAPVIVNSDMTVIGGHQRLKVLKELGYAEIECNIVDLDKNKEKALNLALNKISGEWDNDKLEEVLTELKETDIDTYITGFDFDEVDDILKDVIDSKEDDFDVEQELEKSEDPITKLGDVWLLDQHRLMCGDSTSINDIDKLVNGNKIDMIFTDPPYGMNAVSKSGVLSKTYKNDIMNDDNNKVAIKSFYLCSKYFKECKQVWWGANYYTECLPSAECWIVWDKNNGASDQVDCELAWTNFRSVVRQFTLVSDRINRVHPTQKPIKLITQILEKFDKNNNYNNIIDLFGGSGSTLIACEQTNRKCYTMELDPRYCDVIIKRLESLTGQKAKLEE